MEDGKITVIGKDVDALPEGGKTPIAILVDVYRQEDAGGLRGGAGAPHPPLRQLRRGGVAHRADGTSSGSG